MNSLWSRQISARIDIAAEPAAVWRTLTDLGRYPAWNPFIRRVSGDLVAGRKLSMRIHVPGGLPMFLRPKLLVVDRPNELRWIGHAVIPGLFDGEHSLTLAPVGPQHTRFVQTETFRGVLVPLLGSIIAAGARRGFEAMNAALKQTIETRSGM
jgi:hypothetical protein